MATKPRKRRTVSRPNAPASGVATRQSLLDLKPRKSVKLAAVEHAHALLEVAPASKPKPRKRAERMDARVGRKRNHNDAVDDFELELKRHDIDMEDLQQGARQYDNGTRTPWARACHATLKWWTSLPMGHRRVVWIDPTAGYTEATLPKLSSIDGQQLVARGLADGRWATTRLQLLELRRWCKLMLALTPEERVKNPAPLGNMYGD